MSDIVERLNRGEGCLEEGGKTCISMDAVNGCLCAIAADEITRLTAENEKLGRDYQSARDAHDKVLAENEKLRAALEAALENGVGVSYSCDEDECGNHVCCGEVSYKFHAPDCWTLKARAVLSGDKQ
jgi:ferredoxin